MSPHRPRSRDRLRRFTILALGIALTAVFASDAWSKTRVIVHGSNNTTIVKYRWQFPPCPANDLTYGPSPAPFVAPVNVHSPQLDGCAAPPADPSAWTYQSGWSDATGNAKRVDITHGRAKAGGLSTSATPPEAMDSIIVRVVRSGTTLTVDNFRGELKLSQMPSVTSFILGVYPDLAGADADPNEIGTGANFFGRVQIRHGQALQLSGGFASGDFTLTNNVDGSVSVRPAVGLTKVVTVPSAANAAVVLTGDTMTDVPGSNPIGLVILSLLILSGGVWAVSLRSRSRAA